jgi:hypothetical protein
MFRRGARCFRRIVRFSLYSSFQPGLYYLDAETRPTRVNSMPNTLAMQVKKQCVAALHDFLFIFGK